MFIVLFDPGFTFPYVATKIAMGLYMVHDVLDTFVVVSIRVGDSLIVYTFIMLALYYCWDIKHGIIW